jgi:dCTP deaminase
MGVLSKTLILDRLSKSVDDDQSLVISPFLEDAIGPDSIDLRLGSYFLFPPLLARKAVDVNDKNSHAKELNVHIPFDSELILPAHQTVLGVTLEFIKLPFDLSGQILTKSSVARTFMVIETAPWIHPCYRGCLTLEIANVSTSAIVLRPNMPIGQLILMSIDKPEKSEKLSGRYIGPVRPESPLPK